MKNFENKKKYVYIFVMITSIIIGSLNYTFSGTNAKESDLHFDINVRVNSAKNIMKNDKIDFLTYERILSKLQRGELLESEKKGSIPVEIKTYTEDEFKVKKEIFSDDSYIITKVTDVEKIKEKVKPLRNGSWTSWISNSGTVISSSSYHRSISGATVKKSHGVYFVSFTFDYEYSVDGGNINYTYSENSSSVGGTMSLGASRIIKQKSDSYGPARAEMQFSFSGYGSVASYSSVVGITVNSYGVSAY